MKKWTTKERFSFIETMEKVKSLNNSLHTNLTKLMDYSQPLFDNDKELLEMMSYMVEYCVWMVARKQIEVVPKTSEKLIDLSQIARYYLEQGNTELVKELCDLLDELSVSSDR